MLNTRLRFMMFRRVRVFFISSLISMNSYAPGLYFCFLCQSFWSQAYFFSRSIFLSSSSMVNLRYFKDSEFRKATPSCSIDDMSEEFLQKLDDARALCSYKFVINSAYRSPEYERSRGRSGSSSHCKGLAVDISCLTSACRLKMIIALLAVGFRRIGVYPTFIHVDSDTSKPASLWYGKS